MDKVLKRRVCMLPFKLRSSDKVEIVKAMGFFMALIMGQVSKEESSTSVLIALILSAIMRSLYLHP